MRWLLALALLVLAACEEPEARPEPTCAEAAEAWCLAECGRIEWGYCIESNTRFCEEERVLPRMDRACVDALDGWCAIDGWPDVCWLDPRDGQVHQPTDVGGA
jgi:hypothetical protein